jgi:hypothetical protein
MTDPITILQNKLSSSEVRAVLLALGHPDLLRQFGIREQIQFTLELLNNGAPVREVVRRLMCRFYISRSTAHRRVDSALSHSSRYSGKPLVYAGPMFLRTIPMFIPTARTREALLAMSLAQAGLSQAKAIEVAALIPDFMVCSAVFVDREPLTVELLANGCVFATFRKQDYYLGRITETAVFVAGAPWSNPRIRLVSQAGAPYFNPAGLLKLYNAAKWAREHQLLAVHKRQALDCVSELRGFAECEE